MQALYETKNASLEDALLEALAPDEPWSLIERFTTLVRESSSEDERAAFNYVAERLSALGVPYTMHMPEQFLSVPIQASLEAGGASYRAKTPGFSISTPAGGISGEAVIIEGFAAGRSVDFFDFSPTTEVDVEDKIVVVDGFGGPPPVWYFQNKGAKGAIFINPGVDIHWGICTTIWGAPDLDNYHRQPTIPVVSINRPDGEALLAQLEAGLTEVTLHAELKEGWFECPCLVAEIKGNIEPERFVLVHGHMDSWDIGIGDNAVGDATLLELARIFHNNRDSMARSLRVAWWSGHSTGRYGASTWYADAFGLDLSAQLRGADEHRFARLPLGDRVSRCDGDDRSGRLRRAIGAGFDRQGFHRRAPASSRRLFLQQHRHLQLVHAALVHAASQNRRTGLLRRRRLRRQYRLAYRERHPRNRRQRQLDARLAGLRHIAAAPAE